MTTRDASNTTLQIQVIVRARDNATGKVVGDSGGFTIDKPGYLGRIARERLALDIAQDGQKRLDDEVPA